MITKIRPHHRSQIQINNFAGADPALQRYNLSSETRSAEVRTCKAIDVGYDAPSSYVTLGDVASWEGTDLNVASCSGLETANLIVRSSDPSSEKGLIDLCRKPKKK